MLRVCIERVDLRQRRQVRRAAHQVRGPDSGGRLNNLCKPPLGCPRWADRLRLWVVMVPCVRELAGGSVVVDPQQAHARDMDRCLPVAGCSRWSWVGTAACACSAAPCVGCEVAPWTCTRGTCRSPDMTCGRSCGSWNSPSCRRKTPSRHYGCRVGFGPVCSCGRRSRRRWGIGEWIRGGIPGAVVWVVPPVGMLLVVD